MPSKKTVSTKHTLSRSRDLVPVGPREVLAGIRSRRDSQGHKPTTSRALVLRNGKYGARGTGEVMLMGKMSGREKFELLAGNHIPFFKNVLD